MELYPFQREGVDLISQKHNGRVLLADDMGCLDGETMIKVLVNTRRIRTMTLSHLFYKFNGGREYGYLRKKRGAVTGFKNQWNPDLPRYVDSYKDGKLRPNQIMDVVDSGHKETITLQLTTGKTLTLTPDHVIFTPEGEIEAGKLSVGDSVYVDMGIVHFRQPSPEKIVSTRYTGIRHVYDIVMADPARNFIANGILVHNCGKTIQAVTWLKENKQAMPAIVVCPASVKTGWEACFQQNMNVHPTIFEGETNRQASLRNTKVIVVNYDIVQHRLAELKDFGATTLILDEAQNCINRERQRTKACRELSRVCKYMLALSGTPMTNRPAELWPVLNMLFPKDFSSFWAYGHRYCAPKRTPWGWEFKGATNIEELHNLLKQRYMIRRTKAEVMDQLPQKHRDIVTIELTSPADYEAVEQDYLGWLRKYERHKVDSAKKAMKVSRFGYLRRFAAKQKLRGVVRWINAWLAENPHKKLVVFGWHTKMLTALERRINSNCVLIRGGVPQKQRRLMLRRFREDKTCRVLIGNMGAVGTGLDGMQIASDAAIVELDLRPGVVRQVEDRLHRIGQESTTTIYYLLGEGTIEIPLCELLQRKQEVISSTLDGGKQVGDFDLFDELMTSLL